MSAFPESGRSDTSKTNEMKGRFRPEADIRETQLDLFWPCTDVRYCRVTNAKGPAIT